MEIKGTIRIFPEVKERENDKGEKESYIVIKGTISSKKDEKSYINKSVKVRLAGKNFPSEKVNKLNPDECYTLDVYAGFLGVESFTSKGQEKREVVLVVTEGKLLDHRPVIRKEAPAVDSDLPF